MSDERPPVLAHENYLRHRGAVDAMKTLNERFTYIYERNLWGNDESRSGLGSAMSETAKLRTEIPALLAKIGASSILDLPCGDFRWLSTVDLGSVQYLGADIVEAIVASNKQLFGGGGRRFMVLDLTSDPLPNVDLVLCRDCLVHLSHTNIAAAIANIQRSRAKWLLTTHFLNIDSNHDISDGDWRPLNLSRPPFSFPVPHLVINEGCMEAGGAYNDKSLALWRVTDLPMPHLMRRNPR